MTAPGHKDFRGCLRLLGILFKTSITYDSQLILISVYNRGEETWGEDNGCDAG